MKRFFIFFTLSLFSLQGYCGELASQLDSMMNLYYVQNNFSGSVLVAKDGEVLYADGFGYANIEHNVENSPEKKYRIASISKQFTSMLIMQKVSEGKISLDSTISTYIEDYPKPQGNIITIHHLLSHTSGMPHYAGIPDFFPKYGRLPFEHREFVELFWDLDLLFEPGEEFSYSSFGYYLLGYILEEVSGKTFPELLNDRILEPLEMFNTGVEDHRKIIMNRAYGYNFLLDYFERAGFRDLSTALATGDMYSSPLDMVRWERALADNKLLDKEYQDMIFSPNLDGYAYGWRTGYSKMNENDSVYYHQHTGGTNGFTSIVTRLPEDGYYIVVFCNSRPAEIRSVEQNIIRLLYGYELDFSPSIALALARILESDGLEAALDYLSGFSENEEKQDELSFNDIARVGRDLLYLDRTGEAISIFKVGVELFPQTANAYVMLGDGYHAEGKKEKAIKAYAKALLLEPQHSGALQKIQRY